MCLASTISRHDPIEAALPPCVCVLSLSVFLLCPFPCLFCVPACGRGLLSTDNSQVEPIFNQLPLKAPTAGCQISLCLSCLVQIAVPPSHLVFAGILPACGFSLQAVSSPAFPCLASMLRKTDLTTPRHATTRHLQLRHSW